MTPHAVIAGAGVAGLTSAVALHQNGWRVSVFDRAPVLEPLGAGLGLTPNALRALDVLGLGDAVRERGAVQETGGIRRPDGRWLARSDLAFIRARFGDPVVGLHRRDIITMLAAALPAGSLRTGVTVTSATRDGVVRTSEGELGADLVVAADGIGSRLRAALFPAHPGPVYAGYTSWRMVVPVPDYLVEATETWGRGTRFGLMHLPDGLLHLSANSVAPPRQRERDERQAVLRRFGHWHAPIPDLLAAVEPGQVLHHDVAELATPLPTFHSGRIVLVGDAAHAMTPNIGPACLAMEDAVTLGLLLPADRVAALDSALAEYTALRLPRAVVLARRARRVGLAGQWTWPPAVAARNLGIRFGGLLPASVTARALDGSVDWWPPSRSPAAPSARG
ncbi:FAD-dependent monooxygenase [Crossiella sp. SN42]|uniref:FAD-dependent monooxygenase n=1 Tax=Crossiella sp. SN42 TaxID=2944808 RepID=UPI00207C6F79|nr:FAD-dependent monooxygenase [Crossiella sp. SN42]MCO1574506.1 FAD-dependent monooxygenase [Crossiella sp. SN42]